MMPMPPSCAIAMASRASVTVSIAAETSGMLSSGASGAAPAAAPEAKKDAAGKDKPLTHEQAFQKRQQERAQADQKAAQERAEAQEKRANCDSAQANLRQLQSGQRLTTVNAAGERIYLDDEQRNGQIAHAQKAVADWCK